MYSEIEQSSREKLIHRFDLVKTRVIDYENATKCSNYSTKIITLRSHLALVIGTDKVGMGLDDARSMVGPGKGVL